MMSDKRGPDVEAPVSLMAVQTPPKRSKLDFLAMIAELSEQKQEEPKEVVLSFTAPQQIVQHSVVAEKPTSNPVIKKSPKNDNPKSSFAAWKLAKGRNNQGSKNAYGKAADHSKAKELSTSIESMPPSTVRTDAVVTPTSPTTDFPEGTAMDLMAAAIEQKSSAVVIPAMSSVPSSPLGYAMETLASAAVTKDRELMTTSAPRFPPTKALKHKKALAKKNPKKVGSIVKKNKEGKKVPKKTKESKMKLKNGEHTRPKASSFPKKIMELLQGNLASNAIYWLPEGEAIAVDPDNFKDSTVISKQFRGNKLSSFVRSLNRWGFRRIFYHSLPDKTLAFYHRLFQKQAPLLVKEMKMDGGDKEPSLPPGANQIMGEGMLAAAAQTVEESPAASRRMVASPVELTPVSPAVAASARSVQGPAPGRASPPGTALPVTRNPVPSGILSAAAAAAQPSAGHSYLDHANAVEIAESQHALQQAMIAEQGRSDLALQQQAQQFLLQSLAERQDTVRAEEFLMRSMLAEQQRSDLASQQRQAEHALLQHMVAEEQTAALAAALGGYFGAGVGNNSEAVFRDRLLAQHLLAQQAETSAPASGSDLLALLQGQFQGGQQQAHEPSYMEQLLLLEQQRQRQAELELLAAHGFRF